MIPASNPYLAVYREGVFRKRESSLRVEGWDADGSPLVYSSEHKRLVKAETLDRFDGLQLATDTEKVAALPADGWRAIFTHDNGTEEEGWIIGWAVASSGWTTPIVVVNLNGPRIRCLELGEVGWRLVPPESPAG